MNNVESLKQGFLNLSQNKPELTVLLVGETGVGKTALISYLANVLLGRTLDEYAAVHDQGNEAGGPESTSQTNQARVYVFESRNGVTLRILDTPGLADTRGLAQDAFHKKSIAETISAHVAIVDAVIILANGTIPRLSVATDYALTTLSSIFPRSLANNIGLILTNASSPLSSNFGDDSLPPSLRSASQFFIDNPFAMQRKYLQIQEKGASRKVLDKMKRSVIDGEEDALESLAELFNWIDGLSPQPTAEIMKLYEQAQGIDTRIGDAIACMEQAATKKQELESIIDEVKLAKVNTRNTFRSFKTTMSKKVYKIVPTLEHHEICTEPGCYSNCVERYINPYAMFYAFLGFTPPPTTLLRGSCSVCGHLHREHRVAKLKWALQDDKALVDPETWESFTEAKSTQQKKEALLKAAQQAVGFLSKRVEDLVVDISRLAEEYAQLSLSGNFAGQVEKSVLLLETNLETMRQNGTDGAMIRMFEESLKGMQEKLKLLRNLKNGAVYIASDQVVRP